MKTTEKMEQNKEKRVNTITNDYASKHITFRYLLDSQIEKSEEKADDIYCFLQVLDSLDRQMRDSFYELREIALLPTEGNSIVSYLMK